MFEISILPRILCFMSSNDRKEIILLEKITTGCIAIEIWTSSDRIMREVLRVFLISKIFQWIRPQQITHGTKCWGLLEAIKLKDTEIISYTTKTLFRIIEELNGFEGYDAKITFFMSSSVCISGERPPCTQRNCWFIMAANGKQSKASMQAS